MTWWSCALSHPDIALTVVIVVHKVNSISWTFSSTFHISHKAISLNRGCIWIINDMKNPTQAHCFIICQWVMHSNDHLPDWSVPANSLFEHRKDKLLLHCIDTIPTAWRFQQRISACCCKAKVLQIALLIKHTVLDCSLPNGPTNLRCSCFH